MKSSNETIAETGLPGKPKIGTLLSKPKASGLAGLLGIQASSTLSQANTDIDSTMAIMYSRPFIEKFIIDHGLMSTIFENDWDKESKKWKGEEPSIIDGYEAIKLKK